MRVRGVDKKKKNQQKLAEHYLRVEFISYGCFSKLTHNQLLKTTQMYFSRGEKSKISLQDWGESAVLFSNF